MVVTYCGIFVMLSNHYVLRPRVESLLSKVHITSNLVQEIIIDFMSNLSNLSFLLSSILMTNSDNGFSVVMIGDSMWAGILIAVITIKNFQDSPEDIPESKVIIKNAVMLCLCYAAILYHYIAQVFFISLGASLLGVYVISLLIVGY